MKKKIVLSIILITLIIIALIAVSTNYYSTKEIIKVSDLINFYNSETMPEKIDTSIFFTPHSDKEFTVTNEDSIKEIVDIVRNIKIKIKTKSIPARSYLPKLKDTYHLNFYSKSDEVEYIHILDENYISINDKTYKMAESADIFKIYNIIILDQPKDIESYEFYYDLIKTDE